MGCHLFIYYLEKIATFFLLFKDNYLLYNYVFLVKKTKFTSDYIINKQDLKVIIYYIRKIQKWLFII